MISTRAESSQGGKWHLVHGAEEWLWVTMEVRISVMNHASCLMNRHESCRPRYPSWLVMDAWSHHDADFNIAVRRRNTERKSWKEARRPLSRFGIWHVTADVSLQCGNKQRSGSYSRCGPGVVHEWSGWWFDVFDPRFEIGGAHHA